MLSNVHCSRSENGRKTTASAPAVCRRISVATLTFIAGFPQTDFNTKLVNFFFLAERVYNCVTRGSQANYDFALVINLPIGLVFAVAWQQTINKSQRRDST